MPLHLHILNLGKQSDNINVLVKILWYVLDNKGFKKAFKELMSKLVQLKNIRIFLTKNLSIQNHTLNE